MAATPLSLPAAGHTRRPAAINSGTDGLRRARALHQPRRGEPAAPPSKGQRWGTIAFMVAIHLLAVVALDEGPHLNTTLVGVDTADLRVGLRLRAVGEQGCRW